MDEVPTEIDRLRNNITANRQDRFDTAQRVEGDFSIEDEQVGIESAARSSGQSTLSQIADSGTAGLRDTGAVALGVEVGIRLNSASETYEETGSTSAAIAEAVLQNGKRFDDPDWNPREDEAQRKLIDDRILELGLDIEGPEAESLISAGSEFELNLITEQVTSSRERLLNVSDAGGVGLASYLAASLLDIDSLTGVGVFTKIRKARTINRLADLQKSGKISTEEAAALQNTSSRLDNIKTGAEVGLGSAVVVEGTRALVDPTADEKDVIGAVILSTALGSGIGGVLPAKRVESVAQDLAEKRILKQAFTNDAPAKKAQSEFNKTIKFVEDAEGGFSNNSADRGGATINGISSKFYPKQFKELKALVDSGKLRQARNYKRAFFKGEFYDKVTTPDMTAAQKQVITDTAINSGIGTAQRLYKEAGGDVNKFLELRQQFVEDIVRRDPSQEVFLQGWTNRINNLRDDVAGVRTQRTTPDIQGEDSVGAASVNTQGERFETAASIEIQDRAWDFFDENPEIDAAFHGLDEFVDESAPLSVRLSQGFAQKALRGIENTPFISDYSRLVRDGGVVGRFLAWHTLDNPIGLNVNNRSAAALGDDMSYMAGAMFSANRGKHYSTWAKDQGLSRMSRDYHLKGETDFNKELRAYRENLHATGQRDPEAHPSIVKASDELDQSFGYLLGKNKEHGVEGFEDVEFVAGYTPRNWKPNSFSRIEELPGVGADRVINSLKEGIMRKTPDMDEATALIYASAIRRSAYNSELASPVGMLGTVNADGVAALESAILANGAARTPEEALEMAQSLLYKDSDRGTVTSSRRRIDIDLTTPIEGTDRSLLDLVDNDIYGIADRTVRAQSNHAALASVGIQQRDKARFVRASVDEAVATGNDPAAAQKAVEDMFNMFSEGQVGNADPNASRINKLARLAYLPQLGITQIAEAGLAIGAGGLKGWTHFAKQSIPDMIKGNDVELMNDLFGMTEWVGDHKTFVTSDHLDDFQLQDAPKFLNMVDLAALDRGMDKGMRAMGHISGFYKSNEMLDTLGALTLNNYMVKAIRDGKHSERLKSMGVDDEFRALIQSRMDSGDIEFGETGHVKNMNTHNWTGSEQELLRLVTRRNQQAMLQRTRKGEGNAWQYDTIGSLLSSLKSYVFTAAQKQLVRNARLADPEAFSMLLASTGTAAIAYTASQIVKGEGDSLDVDKIAKGALGWAPIVSPALMVVDPVAFMIGADKIPGSPLPFNDWRYGHNGIISMPAGVTALNQLLEIGRLPIDAVDGNGLTRDSINAIKAIPVIGRSYPMVPIIEQLDKD